MDTPFTARNVAKFLARSIVAAKTAQIAADTIADHTQFEKEDLTVQLSSGVISWYVTSKLEPVTDAMVEKTADFIADKRAKRQAKKKDTE